MPLLGHLPTALGLRLTRCPSGLGGRRVSSGIVTTSLMASHQLTLSASAFSKGPAREPPSPRGGWCEFSGVSPSQPSPCRGPCLHCRSQCWQEEMFTS